ncbi:MAG: GHKL domain-containing protein [Miniphocaeibacter sp.]|uniref:sensor histidine kinase n=1 Tax=Miniphocaeibacter sp. TaxID=3100973 RepID=UPI001809F7A0|nr:GHKL domain-containing protein [Gallicola sp.]
MEREIIYQIIILLVYCLFYFFTLYMSIKTVELLFNKKFKNIARITLSFIILIISLALNIKISYEMFFGSRSIFYYIVLGSIVSIIYYPIIFKIWKYNRESKYRLLLSILISYISYGFFYSMSSILLMTGEYVVENISLNGYLIGLLTYVITLSLQIILYRILRRKELNKLLYSIEFNGLLELFIIISFLIGVATSIYTDELFLESLYSGEVKDNIVFIKIAISFLVEILIIMILIGISSYIVFKNKQLKIKETELLNQKFYIRKMEKVQEVSSALKHDYKNVVSGIYYYVQQGNLEEIKEYLDNVILNFKDETGKSIDEINSLGKIKIVELKGLILSKLINMEDRNIDYSLYILDEIDHIEMDIIDCIRAIGILIDNAIDQVKELKNGKVDISIVQNNLGFTIIIKNTIRDEIELSKIFNRNYSTKGVDRGIGLFNYKNIINRYSNANRETIVDSNNFIQILRIYNK